MEWLQQTFGCGDIGLWQCAVKNKFESVRNLGLIFAAIIGLYLAYWRAHTSDRQAKVAEQQIKNNEEQIENTQKQLHITSGQLEISQNGQLIDRFQKGVAMLESDKLSVRLAGILVLKELAIADMRGYYNSVMDLLCMFVRANSEEQILQFIKERSDNAIVVDADESTPARLYSELVSWDVQYAAVWPTISTDNQYVVEAISEIQGSLFNRPEMKAARVFHNKTRCGSDYPRAVFENIVGFKPRKIDLSRSNLAGLRLDYGELAYADLQHCVLAEAKLSGCELMASRINFTHFYNADLAGADMSWAHAMRANFTESDLSTTNVEFTHFEGAILMMANLEFVQLRSAKGMTVGQLELALNVDPNLLKELAAMVEAEKKEG